MVLFVLFTVFSNRHDPKATHRFNFLLCTNKHFCAVFSANIVLSWRYHSSQNSFDKIITSFFLSTPRRRRDENWLHEARSLIFHTTFKNLGPDTNVQIYLKIFRRVIYFLRYLKNLMIFWKTVIFWLSLRKKYWLKSCFILGSYFNAN